MQANSAISSSQLPDAGSILRDLRNLERDPDTLPKIERQDPAALTDDGQTVILRSVTFEGYQGLVPLEALNNLVADQIGQELGFNGLMALADLVTQYLATQGYFLSFAYLPEQDITDGNLIIATLPVSVEGGRDWVPNITLSEGANFDKQQLAATLRHSMRNDLDIAINAKNMERGLLLVNDLAGISAQSILERGAEYGTTRVNVIVNAMSRYATNLWVDNYGGYYTGSARANGLFTINNLTGQGDKLTALISRTKFLGFGNVSYTAPLSPNGLSFTYAVNMMRYELGNLKEVNLKGGSAGFSLGLRYPILRTRQNNLYISPEYNYTRLDDYTNNNHTKNRVNNHFSITLNGDRMDQSGLGGYTAYSASYKRGDLDLTDLSEIQPDPSSPPPPQGHFATVMMDVTRLQKIHSHGALYLKAQRQMSLSGALDSAETFSGSGSSGVRAYAGGDASGDEGWLLSLEYRYDVPNMSLANGSFQLVGFYDHAKLTGVSANAAEVNSYDIRGAGLELNWTRPQAYSVKATYARKIDDKIEQRSTASVDSEGKSREARLWLQAMWWF